MAWIEKVNLARWQGALADLRNRIVDPVTDQADNIMTVHSLDADGLGVELESDQE